MTPAARVRLRRSLLAWYLKHRRDLPWRRTRDPYRILVSEIMLQQTQVATVVPYFNRFVKSFPTAASLARAPLRRVLKHWEGLGYYARARNLRRAAGVIAKQWKGRIPPDLEALRALPGIGRYTAGAVASIAFGIRAPILDGNVRRVLCRLFEIRTDPRLPAVQDRLWTLAEEILPLKQVGDFNQGLMELGATVCLPRNPDCPACPVQGLCGAHRRGIQDEIPAPAAAGKVPHLQTLVALIRNDGSLLAGPRPAGGLLGGLWSFPEMEWKDGAGVQREIRELTGLRTAPVSTLAPVSHQFSHKRVTYRPVVLECLSAAVPPEPPWKWIAIEKIQDYPLPRAAQKIFGQLEGADRLPLAADPPHPYRPDRKK